MKKLKKPVSAPKFMPRSTKRFTMAELKQEHIDLREQHRKLQVKYDCAIIDLKSAIFDLKVCRSELRVIKDKVRLIEKERPTVAKIMSDLNKRSRER